MPIATIKYLKDIIKDLPDETKIGLTDPNFGGFYQYLSDYEIKIMDGQLLIDFPFVDSVD